eukprot:44374_1
MATSFVSIIYSLIYVVNSMDWSLFWSDDCDTQSPWVCHVSPTYGTANDNCKIEHEGHCHTLCREAYIERSYSISAYAEHHFRLSLYVYIEEPEPADRCRIWFGYDDDDYDITKPDWECGSQVVPCGRKVIIPIPSTGMNTLTVALGADDTDHHTHCSFDTIQLSYRVPTLAPTAAPTPTPTKKPSDPTQTPTSFPTKRPTATPSKPPSPAPTKQPTLSPTRQPSPGPTQRPTVTPTYVPSHDPTQNPSHHPIVTTKNTMQDANGGVSTTANRGDTVRASSGQDPILFVYVAASSIWLILILTCVVAVVLC